MAILKQRSVQDEPPSLRIDHLTGDGCSENTGWKAGFFAFVVQFFIWVKSFDCAAHSANLGMKKVLSEEDIPERLGGKNDM